MSFVLGLDVGTSSAAGATKRNGRVQPCALGDRTATLPAVVVLHDDGSAIVGDEAERVAGLELTRLARDLRNNPSLQPQPITVGGQVHTAQELLRALYSTMVRRVTAGHGQSPTHVVLTHPALPEGVRCEAVDLLADDLFPGALVVPDPVAATVKLACDAVLPTDCTVAVYDLGGGTFDTTVVQRSGDRFSVVGDPGGLADFGGIDIDDLMLDYVDRSSDGVVSALDLHDPAAVAALTRLRAECRDAKERLSYDTEVTIDASVPGRPALVQLTRSALEEIVRPRLETTVAVLQETIERAGLRTQDIDAVALLGGSSRIPLVVDMLTTRTSMQVLVDPYPELTVALGAAQMVDDEAGVSSVFPIADLALPSLASLGSFTGGGSGDPGLAGAASLPSGPDDPTATGMAADDPMAFGGPQPPNGYGADDDLGDDGDMRFMSDDDRRYADVGARSGALVLVGLVGVLMVIGLMVALLGGSDGDGPTATDVASQIDDREGTRRSGDRDGESAGTGDGSSDSSSSTDSSSGDDDDDDSSSDRTSTSSRSSPSGSAGSTTASGGSGTTTGGGTGTTPTSSGGTTTTTRATTTTTEPTTTTTEPTTTTTEPTTTTTTEAPPPALQASWTTADRD